MGLEEIFINNLRRIRKEKKITQEKLAELCQTDTSYIGQIEIGKRFPSIALIEKIAMALDTPAYLLFKEPENPCNYDESVTKEDVLMILEKVATYISENDKK